MDYSHIHTLAGLLRLTLGGCLIFLVLPYLAVRGPKPRLRPWYEDMAAGFTRVSFCLLFGIAALGYFRAALPGAGLVLYVGWLAAAALPSRWHGLLPGAAIRTRIFTFLESPRPLFRAALRWEPIPEPLMAFFVVLAVSAFAYGASLLLPGFRFIRPGDAEQALSLYALTSGAEWDANPHVVLLAPLTWFLGAGAPAAVRLDTALQLVLLSFSIFACAMRYAPAAATGQVAAGLGLVAWVVAEGPLSQRSAAPELTAIFALLAAARAGRSWTDSGLALLSMVYTGADRPVLLWLAAAAAIVAWVIAIAPARWITRPSLAWTPALALIVFSAQGRPSTPETFQYESAARATAKIVSGQRDRDWILISSGQEAAQIAGHGWHVPLAGLVARMEQGGEPAMPYQARNVFVLIERRPLRTGLRSLAPGSGDPAYFEATDAGRASLHFRAARLMARYAALFPETEIYYQDEDVVVYRINAAEAPNRERSR
ncbi:MAG: hypothetical protein FJW39_07360 [Acidobacteria bacterium]|nr:hypothetical protein [Acidobacteriota bacterium]